MTKFDKFAYHKSLRGAVLSAPEYRVLSTLWDYADADGTNARPGHERLAEDCGMAVKTVGTHVASLLTKGWLREDRRGGSLGRNGGSTAASYTLQTPESPAKSGGSLPPESPAKSGRIIGHIRENHRPDSGESPAESGRLPDHLPDQRKDQLPDHLQNASNPLTCVAPNLGSAREDEPTEELTDDDQADGYGREPTEEELHDIETDTDDWNSMTDTIHADPFGIEAEEDRRREEEENEFNRIRQEQAFRLQQFIEDERAREMAL
jgi:hypothetical protein